MRCPNCDYEIKTAEPIKIAKAVQTCMACPAQWDAWTKDDEYVYVRYRWGHLTIDYGVHGESIFEKGVGGGMDGVMDFDELKRHTTGVIEWPDYDEVEEEEY